MRGLIRRVGLVLAVALASAATVRESAVLAQADARSSSLPNPYLPGEAWGKLPDGRTWGAPAAVDLDPDGKSVWVFERCGKNTCNGSMLAPILKFDASGALVKSFGAGQFLFPHGMAVDRDGNLWLADGQGASGKGHQVFKYSADGKLLLTLGRAGVAGEGPDTFNMPADVAVAANGDVFVSDGHNPLETNMRIVKFSKTGAFIKSWGRKGSAPGELSDPHSIAFDSKGRLFVADRGNDRIQIFDQDGKVLDIWKQFGKPSGLFISNDDTLYVADQQAGIRIGSAVDGTLKAWIKAPAGATRVAESVAVDAAGNIYGGENGAMKLVKYVKN